VNGTAQSLPRALARLARPNQWIKNAFVFVGLLFGHAWNDPVLARAAAVAFAAFCLAASGVYAVNDIADRERDRHHPVKRLRPVAAGTVGVGMAAGFAAVLLLLGLGTGYLAGPGVVPWVAGYVILNLLYSFGAKQVVVLDVFFVSAGFMVRILAGTEGLGIPPSQWLLLCGFMATLFLAVVKRRAEAGLLAGLADEHRAVLARYAPEMLDKIIAITAACVILSYSLYTMSPETVRVHGTAGLIYTVPFVVYGLFRDIFILHDQGRGGDPSRDLLRDPHILLAGAGWVVLTFFLVA